MDQSIFHLINQQWTSPGLDLFMAALSDSTIWKPLFVVIGVSAVLFGGFRARALLKSTINRHRPKHVDLVRMVQLQRTHPAFLTLFKKPTIRFSNLSDRNRSGPSFPSGHMTTNAIIAVFCTLSYRRWGWLYWFIAAAVGYSRIYLGSHWPSDVIAAFFLVIGEALLLFSVYELVWRKAVRKWAPQVFARHPSLIARPTAKVPSPGAPPHSI